MPTPITTASLADKLSTTTPVTQDRDRAMYNWLDRHQHILSRNKDIKPDVVFLGDSIVHYWGGDPEAPLAINMAAWSNCFAGFSVGNLGFGWDRTENVLWRIEHGELKNIHPKLIIIKIGTNNIGFNAPENIAAGIKAVCAAAHTKQPAAKILLLGILPRKDEHPGHSFTEQVNGMLDDRFCSIDYVTFRNFGNAFRNDDGTPNTSLYSDDVHINAAGYDILGEKINAEIATLLTSGPC